MKFLCLIGTRPEAIKMSPVIRALRERAEVITLCSGQHTDMVASALKWFDVASDDIIDLPGEGRSLSALTGALFHAVGDALERHRPDVVLAQGDTTTVMVAATASFYRHIGFGHVEAGLRTGNLRAPFPEEFNRLVAGRLARWHFCPTEQGRANLLAENVAPETIFVTGNTVIDALQHTLKSAPPGAAEDGTRRRILVTAHRRENHGARLTGICNAIKRLIEEFSDIAFTMPVHPNPDVRKAVYMLLDGQERVRLTPPLDYPELVAEMQRCHFILTDSGGIQEEAPYLHKPVLVMRDVTERPEAVKLGVVRLIGVTEQAIVDHARELLRDDALYRRMAQGGSPYGDGKAALRIRDILLG